eukprot:g5381.t1
MSSALACPACFDSDQTVVIVSYFILCLDTVALFAAVFLFYKYRVSFPLSGRPLPFYWFLLVTIFVLVFFLHLRYLLPYPGPSCASKLAVLSVTQNLAVGTILFMAWSLFFRKKVAREMAQLAAELQALGERLMRPGHHRGTSSGSQSRMAARGANSNQPKPAEQPVYWYQQHRVLAAPRTFFSLLAFTALLCLINFAAMMATEQLDRGLCLDNLPFLPTFLLLLGQMIFLAYLAVRLSFMGGDNFGMQRELSHISWSCGVLMAIYVTFQLADPPAAAFYNAEQLLQVCCLWLVLLFSYLVPAARAYRTQRRFSTKALEKTIQTITLDMLLKNDRPEITHAFIDFLSSEFSLENWLFWHEAETWLTALSVFFNEPAPLGSPRGTSSGLLPPSLRGSRHTRVVSLGSISPTIRSSSGQFFPWEKLEKDLRQLYDLYIASSAPRQVNLVSLTFNTVVECMKVLQKADNAQGKEEAIRNARDPLKTAQMEIYGLMQTDSFRRFQLKMRGKRLQAISARAFDGLTKIVPGDSSSGRLELQTHDRHAQPESIRDLRFSDPADLHDEDEYHEEVPIAPAPDARVEPSEISPAHQRHFF